MSWARTKPVPSIKMTAAIAPFLTADPACAPIVAYSEHKNVFP
jgi:hypothetical protein